MKKTIILLTVIALVLTGSYFVFAQDPMGGGMMRGGMMSSGMQGRGMMMDSMGSMMSRSALVATQDGGVIIMGIMGILILVVLIILIYFLFRGSGKGSFGSTSKETPLDILKKTLLPGRDYQISVRRDEKRFMRP